MNEDTWSVFLLKPDRRWPLFAARIKLELLGTVEELDMKRLNAFKSLVIRSGGVIGPKATKFELMQLE